MIDEVSGGVWSGREVELLVLEYLRMLRFQLLGQAFVKTRHLELLAACLPVRNRSSIEYKLRNVSWVMLELGFPVVNGYKPLRNIQKGLFDVVAHIAGRDSLLADAASISVTMPAAVPDVEDLSSVMVPRPQSRFSRLRAADSVESDPRLSLVRRDYLAQEARNSELGLAGELFVIDFERWRLRLGGRSDLAARIEHVSLERGDGAGFDVKSFDEFGQEMLIEVKTTSFVAETPFYASRREIQVSREAAAHFFLYRVFDFRGIPRIFSIQGAFDDFCTLDPVSYRATLI